MPGITTVSDVVGRWFAVVVLAAGAVALAAPDLFAGWHRGGALVSVAAITAVVAVVVAASASTLLTVGALVVVAVVLHNVLGLVLGYAIARGCGLDASARRAVSIEVGMQNSGLAAALATVHFSPSAALPAAIFSVWHNVSGSLLASSWSRRDPDDPRRAHVASARRLGRPLQDEARR